MIVRCTLMFLRHTRSGTFCANQHPGLCCSLCSTTPLLQESATTSSMLAVIAPSQPVAAVLAAPNELCLVPKPSSLQQHKDHLQSQQRDAVHTQVLQPANVNNSSNISSNQAKQPMTVSQLHYDQGAASTALSTPAVVTDGAVEASGHSSSSLPGRKERRPSRGERRLSNSQRKVAPPVAGYSTDSYWNSRYAERSTHFDWFYNYSALAELINTACDSEAGPCLHVGCGNSGFSEGMVQDGYEVSTPASAQAHPACATLHCSPGTAVGVLDS